MKDKIIVSNIKCDGCVATIKDNLLKLEGVYNVIVSKEESLVDIEHDVNISREVFINKLAALGYPENIDSKH